MVADFLFDLHYSKLMSSPTRRAGLQGVRKFGCLYAIRGKARARFEKKTSTSFRTRGECYEASV